jgi:hypothetical protein
LEKAHSSLLEAAIAVTGRVEAGSVALIELSVAANGDSGG